jgi:alanine racemase
MSDPRPPAAAEPELSPEDIGPCNSYLEVNLRTFGGNIRKVREYIRPQEVIVVLKANAYSLGLAEVGAYITGKCGVKALGCAQAGEGIKLREAGISADILVLGGVPFNNIPAVVEYDLMTPAYQEDYLSLLDREAAARGKTARVQIKVETGMGRIGVKPGDQLEKLCDFLKTKKHLQAVGVYTHFAESEALDKTFTRLQLERFHQALDQLKALGMGDLQYIHACNSTSVSWLRDDRLSHVRAAGIFFGYDCCLDPVNALAVEECLAWRAFVTNVKTVEPGETVGYNRFYKAESPRKIATVSAGYGDGYPRFLGLSKKADFLVNGRRARVIGFCMDQSFIDVTGIPCGINDRVTLLGKDGDERITALELQEKMGHIYLAAIAAITTRVKRVYIQ